MEENLKWVWYAFSIGWGLHALYVVSLSVRQKRLSQQIQDLKNLLSEQQGKSAGD